MVIVIPAIGSDHHADLIHNFLDFRTLNIESHKIALLIFVHWFSFWFFHHRGPWVPRAKAHSPPMPSTIKINIAIDTIVMGNASIYTNDSTTYRRTNTGNKVASLTYSLQVVTDYETTAGPFSVE
jgi:hypothetical protein